MGTFCPICQTHQPFTQHLTTDQSPAVRASDVIGHKLGCGHIVGGESFNKFRDVMADIDKKLAKKIAQLQQDAADAKAAAWTQIKTAKSGEGAS